MGWLVESARRHPVCASCDQRAVAGLVEFGQRAGGGHPIAVVAVKPLVPVVPARRAALSLPGFGDCRRPRRIPRLARFARSKASDRRRQSRGVRAARVPGVCAPGKAPRPTLRSRDVGAHRADARRGRAPFLQRGRLPLQRSDRDARLSRRFRDRASTGVGRSRRQADRARRRPIRVVLLGYGSVSGRHTSRRRSSDRR